MNYLVFEHWVTKHLIPGWSHFLSTLSPERRDRARLAVLSDHHPGHVRFVGARACGAKLLSNAIGFCHVGRECTSTTQPVDVGSCARSLKAAMRRERPGMNVEEEVWHLLRHARQYQTQYSSEQQFRRLGWLLRVEDQLPVYGLSHHLADFLSEQLQTAGPHPSWDSARTRLSRGFITLHTELALAPDGEDNLPEPELNEDEDAASDTEP